jgi:hypothetical protein
MSPSTDGPPPTPAQLRYLRLLADQTETSFVYPRTKAEAGASINQLRALTATTRRIDVEEQTDCEPSLASDPNVYATAAHSDEIAGSGSSARWRTTPSRDPESLPTAPVVGQPVELARYLISSGERVIVGQRIAGRARISDCPADGEDRSYLIEDDVHLDGNAAMKALIADYLSQAKQLDAEPAVNSLIGRDLQLEKAH